MNINPKKIVYADLDDTEGVLLNVETKRYYKLNETAQVIWRSIQKNKTPADIITELTQTFDIDSQTASTDVETFITHLKSEFIA